MVGVFALRSAPRPVFASLFFDSTLRATEVSQYVYCSLNGGIRQVLIERSIGAPDQRWFDERAMGSTCGVHEVTYGQFSN
jgi:hypothetical protein